MKIFLLCALAAALSSGITVSLVEAMRDEPAPREPVSQALLPGADDAAPAAASTSGKRSEQPISAATNLETAQRIVALESRIAELEAALMRRPVEVESPVVPPTEVASLEGDGARALVLDVLAAEEERERAEREVRREEQRLERMDNRVSAIATELGLADSDRAQLLEVYLMEDEQWDAARDAIRESGDWDSMRTEMDAIRTWKSDELVTRFGADMAGQIEAVEGEQRWGRGGPGGGRGGRGGF